MNKPTFAIALLLLAGGTAFAQQQQVYRCGNTYSQQPCPDAKVVNVDDTRSAGAAAANVAETQREQKAADAMEKARLEQEARAAKANAAPKQPEPKPQAKDDAEPRRHAKKHSREPKYFTAVAPRAPKPKKKASAA